jgi:maleylacetoacetate isomerase
MAEVLIFDYFSSSASYRVRIALNQKGIAYRSMAVDLAAGAQRDEAYCARNPQALVPLLEIDGHSLTQSMAIIDYLETTRPLPALLPADAADRAHVLALALAIVCDVHPLNNLRVLNYLAGELDQDQSATRRWYAHWITEGFTALETLARPRAGRFLFGDSATLADVCLVPQLYNARRFEVPLGDFPTLLAAEAQAAALDAFAAAHPDRVKSGD